MAAPSLPKDHPKVVIPEMGRLMYNLGWATGTGGSLSMRYQGKIYISPSGVMKEKIRSDELFVVSDNGEVSEGPPPGKKLRISLCTPLFMCVYELKGVGTIIHSHSSKAVMATLLFPGKTFCASNLEQIKGIRKCRTWSSHRFDETLTVPVIENTCEERDLLEDFQQTIVDHPDTCAVLIRRHGLYVWGRTWEEAKGMAECYDYIFDVAVEMKKCGLDPVKTDSSKTKY
jgi:methylthioribulose-1-phosphate dehydratase